MNRRCNPEQHVIDEIDALVNEQLRHPHDFHQLGDKQRCELCGGSWHGLPGDGPANIFVTGVPGAEGYEQTRNGGTPGCPGAHATDEQRTEWCEKSRTRRPDWRTRWGEPPSCYVDQIVAIRSSEAAQEDPQTPSGPLEDVILAYNAFRQSCAELRATWFGDELRCIMCERVLQPNNALIGLPPGTYWCDDCAASWISAHADTG